METSFDRDIAPPNSKGLPGWLRIVNPIVIALQRKGVAIGTMHVLTVPGRRSGTPRSTPVSLLTLDGERFIVAGLDNADWVLNARAARRGVLRRGRFEVEVALVELPVDEREPVLRAFPRLVPHGVRFFTQLYGVTADPDAFAQLAATCPVFLVEHIPDEQRIPEMT
jgi:deazaflavin-dependent oxidoreductase (nitroreductase family)